MKYITIDGDDVGQKIAYCYLQNDPAQLAEINDLVQSTTRSIADFLRSQNFTIIFCAADGVSAYSSSPAASDERLFRSITELGDKSLTFSAGTGPTLRDAYIALLSAKSSGKACLCTLEDTN
jgi:hypothetical protein